MRRRRLVCCIQKGHRVIGVLQGLSGTLPNEQRLLGHAMSLGSNGVESDESLIAGSNFTEASGYYSAVELLQRRPDITAFFALSTPNAMGATRAARELGRRVPDDLSIVAFDDSPFADLMKVPLTTVRQNVDRIGELASNMLLKALSSTTKLRKTRHEVQVQLILRNSVTQVRH